MSCWSSIHLTAFFDMYVLYCDISGNVGGSADTHIVLGGVCIREDAIYHVIKELDEIVAESDLALPQDIELHSNEILAGRKFWRRIPPEKRRDFLKTCLNVFSGPSRHNMRTFGIVVEKAKIEGDPILYAYEQLVTRFNSFLRRDHESSRRRHGSFKHRGLIIFDASRYETELQGIAREYRINGTRWGQLPFLGEVPLFSDSKASRLIQLADLVAYGLYRRFEREDRDFLRVYAGSFDRHSHRTHGMYHLTSNSDCDCLSCTKT